MYHKSEACTALRYKGHISLMNLGVWKGKDNISSPNEVNPLHADGTNVLKWLVTLIFIVGLANAVNYLRLKIRFVC